MTKKRVLRALTVLAAAGSVSVLAVGPAQAAAYKMRIVNGSGDVIGRAIFNSGGATESLQTCDDAADGVSISSQLYWNGAVRMTDGDPTHGAQACGAPRQVQIPEGTSVWMRIAANSSWGSWELYVA